VAGLRGRGGYTVGIAWSTGQANEFLVRADRDGTVKLRARMFTTEFTAVDITDGTTPTTTRLETDAIGLNVRAGHTYRLQRRGTVPTDYVRLVNRNSGKIIGVNGGSTADGATIVQQTDTGAAGQRWRIADAGGGYVKVVNRNSGKVLDVNAASTADGAAVIQWTDHGGANQQWTMPAA
jgi:alpha-L-fucosidase 2